MGYIVLNSVTFSPTPTAPQTVTIEYKLTSSGTYLPFTSSANVLADGTFSPTQTITGLTDGESYDVRITPNCGGAAVIHTYILPAVTTTTSTTSVVTTTTTSATSCTEYYNNSGSILNGISYVDCSGVTHANETVTQGQSICAADGSLTGGDSGYLIVLGTCT